MGQCGISYIQRSNIFLNYLNLLSKFHTYFDNIWNSFAGHLVPNLYVTYDSTIWCTVRCLIKIHTRQTIFYWRQNHVFGSCRPKWEIWNIFALDKFIHISFIYFTLSTRLVNFWIKLVLQSLSKMFHLRPSKGISLIIDLYM